jgi:hypothetical protein
LDPAAQFVAHRWQGRKKVRRRRGPSAQGIDTQVPRCDIWSGGVDGDSDILYIFQKKHLAIPGRFKSIFKDGVHPATIIIMCGEAACSCYKLVWIQWPSLTS